MTHSDIKGGHDRNRKRNSDWGSLVTKRGFHGGSHETKELFPTEVRRSIIDECSFILYIFRDLEYCKSCNFHLCMYIFFSAWCSCDLSNISILFFMQSDYRSIFCAYVFECCIWTSGYDECWIELLWFNLESDLYFIWMLHFFGSVGSKWFGCKRLGL